MRQVHKTTEKRVGQLMREGISLLETHSGRPPIKSNMVATALKKMMARKKPPKPRGAILRELARRNMKINARTLKQLVRDDKIRAYHVQKRPFFTKEHVKARIAFCKAHRDHRGPKLWVFSDEWLAHLFPNHVEYHYGYERPDPSVINVPTVHSGGDTLTFGFALGIISATLSFFVDEGCGQPTLNAEDYQKILQEATPSGFEHFARSRVLRIK